MDMVYILLLLWLCRASIETDKRSSIDNNKEIQALRGFYCSTNEYPFMVIIMKILKNAQATRICGGTLINSKHVLTAASCLGEYRLIVTAGVNSPLQNPVLRSVIRQIPHPFYNNSSLRNNMAILLLDYPIEASPQVNYASLPHRALDHICDKALAINWGHTKLKNDSSDLPDLAKLECALQPIVDNEKCKSMSSSTTIDKQHLCTLALECQQDAGGPLFCGILQVGVYSMEVGCDNPDHTAIYTRTDQYINFVQQYVKSRRYLITNGSTHIHIGITKWVYLFMFLQYIFSLLM